MPFIVKGFAKAIPREKSTTNISQMVDVFLKKSAAENSGGVIQDPQIYRNAIKLLTPYSGNSQIAEKIYGLEAEAKKLEQTQDAAVNDKNYIEAQVEDAMQRIAAANYKNPQALIFKTAELLNVVKDKLDNETIPLAIQKGNGAAPAELIKFYKDIQDKTKTMTNLANSYLISGGPSNPDAFGVFIQTNPDNGQPLNIQIKPVNSLDESIKGYTKTEKIKYGKLPVYLNTSTIDGKESANLLGKIYEKSDETKMISGAPNDIGAIEKTIRAIGSETWQSLSDKENNLDLSGASFGSNAVGVPKDSVLTDAKKNLYYVDGSGSVWKANSKDELKRYLAKNGKDANSVDNRVFLVDGDFLRANPYTDPATKQERIINDNLTGGLVNNTPSSTGAINSPADEPQTSPIAPTSLAEAFKKPSSLAPSRQVDKSKEYKGKVTGYDVSSILEKGKQLFSGFVK